MPLYRPQRGNLDDAMQEMKDFQSLDELILYLQEDLFMWFGKQEINKDTLHIKPYCFDERINWDTYIVTLDGWGVVGFTNGLFP